MLGGNDINGLVGVEIYKVFAGKLVCKTSAYNFSAIKTEYSIDDSAGVVIGNKLLCNCLSF